jgi:uncharacterized GH25 family protein
MIEEALEGIAEKILAFDEASLSSLWEKYKEKTETFEPTKEWEKATIVFFIINSVKAKNHIFNEQISQPKSKRTEVDPEGVPYLKRIK